MGPKSFEMRHVVGVVVLSSILAACGAQDGPVTTAASPPPDDPRVEDGEGTPTDDSVSPLPPPSDEEEHGETLPSLPEGTLPSPVVDQEVPDPITGEVPAAILAEVRADASSRIGVPASELVEIRSQQMVWNDGSLGCAVPGEAYVQVVTDGYWIVLAVGDTLLDYRVSADGSFRLCERASSGL